MTTNMMTTKTITDTGRKIICGAFITAAVTAAVFLGILTMRLIKPYIFLPGYSKPVSKEICDNDRKIVIRQKGRRVRVYSHAKLIWELSSGVRAQDFLYADVDHDGTNELLILCWRRGRYGRHRPTWVKHDELKWSQHIFIYEIKDDVVRPEWMASDIGMSAAAWGFSEGILSIEDTEGIVTKWIWRSWGLEKL